MKTIIYMCIYDSLKNSIPYPHTHTHTKTKEIFLRFYVCKNSVERGDYMILNLNEKYLKTRANL